MSILDLAHALLDPAQFAQKAPKPVVGTGNFKKKVVSETLAVNPEQVPEFIAEAKKRGVSVEFDRHGRPVFDNSSHFREYAKKHGFRHRGYY